MVGGAYFFETSGRIKNHEKLILTHETHVLFCFVLVDFFPLSSSPVQGTIPHALCVCIVCVLCVGGYCVGYCAGVGVVVGVWKCGSVGGRLQSRRSSTASQTRRSSSRSRTKRTVQY